MVSRPPLKAPSMYPSVPEEEMLPRAITKSSKGCKVQLSPGAAREPLSPWAWAGTRGRAF